MDFTTQLMSIQDKTVKVQFWDTVRVLRVASVGRRADIRQAGQERFRSLISACVPTVPFPDTHDRKS